MSLPPIAHFSPEGSPLNKTYELLLRDAHRKDALDDRREQRIAKSPPPTTPGTPNSTVPITTPSPTTTTSPFPTTPHSATRKKRKEPPTEFDGSHVQTQAFAADLLERVGLNDDPEERDNVSTAPSPLSYSVSSSVGGSSRGGTGGTGGAGGRHSPHSDSRRTTPASSAQPPPFEIGASPTMLRRNVNLVEVLNDVQQTTLCFQEIIKHISFHRVNTGRVLWKLQATYVQLFERLIQVFSQRAKKEAAAIKESG